MKEERYICCIIYGSYNEGSVCRHTDNCVSTSNPARKKSQHAFMQEVERRKGRNDRFSWLFLVYFMCLLIRNSVSGVEEVSHLEKSEWGLEEHSHIHRHALSCTKKASTKLSAFMLPTEVKRRSQ